MKSRSKKSSLIVFSILMFGYAAVGHAAGALTLARSATGQYVVQGSGFDGVAGTEVVIQYNKTALKNPRVVQGGLVAGALMVTNTNEAGTVRIATIDAYPQTNSGTGTVATITFDSNGSAPENVSLIKGTALDVNGHVLIGQTDIPAVAGDTSVSGGSTVTAAPAPVTGGSPGAPVWLGGSVSLPAEEKAVEAKVKEEAPVPIPDSARLQAESGDKTGKEGLSPDSNTSTAAPMEKKAVLDMGVLEQFRTFQKEKSPQNLVALFASVSKGSKQEPPVVLSDGKSVVKITIDIDPPGKEAPNFALRGAKLVTLKRSGDTKWVIEALPTTGTFDATISVLHDGMVKQIPLTVAPPLPADLRLGAGGTLTESDFTQFLKERGTDKAPRYDLNGDWKRDYIDDYIFTANYLVKHDAGKKP